MWSAVLQTGRLLPGACQHASMPGRVLVVEDDDRIRTLLRVALEDEGYAVAEAESGEAGVEAMRSVPADLLIVDLMLGGMDGFTCIRQVRRFSDAPIVVVSARADTHDIVAGLEAGADDYVTKPFQVKEVTARLRALRRRVDRGAQPPSTDVVLDADAPDAPLVLSAVRGSLRGGGGAGPPDADRVQAAQRAGRGPRPGAEPPGAAGAGVGARLLR